MTDIELVIKIPEKTYIESKIECEENDKLIINTFTYAIGKGIPLPKGHVRLIDADTIPMYRIRGVTEYDTGYNDRTTEVENDIKNAPTIIESDKENIE